MNNVSDKDKVASDVGRPVYSGNDDALVSVRFGKGPRVAHVPCT